MNLSPAVVIVGDTTARAAGYVAAATQAATQVAIRNPVATCMVAGVVIGAGTVVLAYRFGPQTLTFIRRKAASVGAWVQSQASAFAIAATNAVASAPAAGPVIDGVAEPA